MSENDIQVDAVQGRSAYKKALARAGNKNIRVEFIANAGDKIILSETGSMEERCGRSAKKW